MTFRPIPVRQRDAVIMAELRWRLAEIDRKIQARMDALRLEHDIAPGQGKRLEAIGRADAKLVDLLEQRLVVIDTPAICLAQGFTPYLEDTEDPDRPMIHWQRPKRLPKRWSEARAKLQAARWEQLMEEEHGRHDK